MIMLSPLRLCLWSFPLINVLMQGIADDLQMFYRVLDCGTHSYWCDAGSSLNNTRHDCLAMPPAGCTETLLSVSAAICLMKPCWVAFVVGGTRGAVPQSTAVSFFPSHLSEQPPLCTLLYLQGVNCPAPTVRVTVGSRRRRTSLNKSP